MRKALVTAASKGIGWGIAEYLLKSGNQVGITARSESGLATRRKENSSLLAAVANHDFPSDTKTGIQELIKQLGGLDTLVLNAPPPKKGVFTSLSQEDWLSGYRSLFEMNIIAIQESLNALKQSHSGRIIFILSTAAKEPIEGLLISSSLRAGLLGLMKSLSREFAQFGITVNAVLPGYTETPGLNSVLKDATSKELIQSKIPLGKLALVCDHGALVSFLSEERNNYITGQTIAVDGGLIAGI
jgi:3-oxoacyl-[acyl-carrier protein] reductase